MKKNFDSKNKALLKSIQNGLPLTAKPFNEIGQKLGITETEVISSLKTLMDLGFARKIGAVISPTKIGYCSILAAIDVPEEDAEEIALIINEFPSVTHNYFRDGHPNLWFTLIEPNLETLNLHLQEIEKKIGKKILRMPVTKLFKIGVKFDF
ncbi:MAG: Lrp/AsnC family transcriptional regulator [Candidatus Bathyarchaeota archaeon]|nr:Lrp/AsnC family transcriptional regulator [Candidatus Bathyarchaeum tardum]